MPETFFLHFSDRSLGDVVLDVLVVQDIVDDLAQSWEVLKQVDLCEIVHVVDDAGEVNVSPGCLLKKRFNHLLVKKRFKFSYSVQDQMSVVLLGDDVHLREIERNHLLGQGDHLLLLDLVIRLVRNDCDLW